MEKKDALAGNSICESDWRCHRLISNDHFPLQLSFVPFIYPPMKKNISMVVFTCEGRAKIASFVTALSWTEKQHFASRSFYAEFQVDIMTTSQNNSFFDMLIHRIDPCWMSLHYRYTYCIFFIFFIKNKSIVSLPYVRTRMQNSSKIAHQFQSRSPVSNCRMPLETVSSSDPSRSTDRQWPTIELLPEQR